jgi:nuclear transcription Y subunit beta
MSLHRTFLSLSEIDSYDDGNEHHNLPRYTGPLREQDRFLPIANIAKIMKKGVPEKGKIAKDAKETLQEYIYFFSFKINILK